MAKEQDLELSCRNLTNRLGIIMTKTRTAILLVLMSIILGASSCSTDADTARRNLDLSAEQFEVTRRIAFINGITDNYMLEVLGRCSYEVEKDQVVLICRTAEDEYWKHSMVRSDNVTVVVEQIEGSDVDPFRHRVIFKPEALLPDIDIETRSEQEAEAQNSSSGQG